MLRLGALVALAALAPALEIPKDGSWTFQALGGADLAFMANRPASAIGSVEAAYQGLAMAADRADYTLVQIPGLSSLTIGKALLSPAAAPGSRVTIDTRASTLPKLPLRALLTPVRITITRLEASPDVVRWQVDLDDLGDADLELQVRDRWAWHHLWAQEAHLRVEAPILNHALGPFRLVDADFVGRTDPGDGTGRLARLDRYAPDTKPPAEPVGGIEAATIHLAMDAQGQLQVRTVGVVRAHGSGLADFRAP